MLSHEAGSYVVEIGQQPSRPWGIRGLKVYDDKHHARYQACVLSGNGSILWGL
jgi:hypothetical protein